MSGTRAAPPPGNRREKLDWERIEGDWAYFKAKVRQRWGRISPDELDAIGGRRDRLAQCIRELYGISQGAAEMQLESWLGRLEEPGAAAV